MKIIRVIDFTPYIGEIEKMVFRNGPVSKGR